LGEKLKIKKLSFTNTFQKKKERKLFHSKHQCLF